jgi:alpha-glucosidase (family GH31 glycosyl hydrolase)
LPAGEWIDLNTGETIVSTGQSINVSANLAQIPLYLNTSSEYAEQMQELFAGDTWQSIIAYAKQLDNAQ